MKQEKRLFSAFLAPFQTENGIDNRLILIFALINSLVFINAFLHDPRIGYDMGEYLKYIQALSKFHLVTPLDSYEFFSPPLPFTFPALVVAITGLNPLQAAKIAQLFNVILSIGLTWYLVKACQLLGSHSTLRIGTLAFLGILPVYYKTFAFVRGEPFVAFFTVVILYYTLLITIKKQFTATNNLILGGAMGLCALSRQWGILIFPIVFLHFIIQWIRLPKWRQAAAKTILTSVVLIAAVSGWFYISLKIKFNSFAAFNRHPAGHFSFKNQPADFYFGLSPKLLFSNPVRPNFSNQFLPIFYSEIWGDYWGYYTVYGRDTRTSEYIDGYGLSQILSNSTSPSWLETNYNTIGAYLGRVNLVSIFPTMLAIISLIYAAIAILKNSADSLIAPHREIYALLLLAIGAIFVGYFWFLIMYSNIGKGDTIKATYVLQIFPILALMAGTFIENVRRRSRLFYRLILAGLLLSFVHNISAMITHFSLLRL